MTKNPFIELCNLNLFIGKERILKDISIRIPGNRITAIIGPSGCGKTSLLKCFNRLVETVEGARATGRIIVDGQNILDENADISEIRKKMGLLLQKPYPLPMSIFDNVAYGPRIHGMKNKKRLKEIVEHHLIQVGLWEEVKGKLNSPATALSVGQQQRLCLARGLAVEPEIILADESTSALDPVSSSRIESRFSALKENYTIIMVTHILRQAKRLADYVIFMYYGRALEAGPAREIFENPQNEITRQYISGVIS